nr:MAG TPA: hypothetical protein [Bacteriophage sp.]
MKIRNGSIILLNGRLVICSRNCILNTNISNN